MMEFPGNSKSNPPGSTGKPNQPVEKKIEKVTTGEVSKRKKSVGSKFKRIFLGGEIRSVAKFVAAGVIVPSLRNLLADVLHSGTDRMVFGDKTVRRPPPSQAQTSRIAYHSPGTIGRDPREATYSQRQTNSAIGPRRDDFVVFLSSKEDAEMVLDQMYDILNQYHVVSIMDLNELIGLEGSYVDNDWGWTYLNTVTIRQLREGYVIDFPQAEPIRTR